MKRTYGEIAFIILSLLLLAHLLACAGPQAARMAGQARTEIAAYSTYADATVKNAEDHRLELELLILQEKIRILLKTGADPDKAAADIIQRVQAKIAEHDQRLEVWRSSESAVRHANQLLDSVAKYNSTGVSAKDATGMINSTDLSTLTPLFAPKPRKAKPSANSTN